MPDKIKKQLLDELVKKSALVQRLEYCRGYATGVIELLKMVNHVTGGDDDATITVGKLAELAEIGAKSLPEYNEYIKEKGL